MKYQAATTILYLAASAVEVLHKKGFFVLRGCQCLFCIRTAYQQVSAPGDTNDEDNVSDIVFIDVLAPSAYR